MNRVRNVLTLGLLVGCTGCASLNRGAGVQTAAERAATAPQAEAGIDPFRPPAETPSARISRYFPGLARASASLSPATEGLRRGARSLNLRDRDPDRQAVPRPDSRGPDDGETATAATTPRGRLRARFGHAPAPRREGESKLTSSERPSAPDAAPLPPLLTAAMVAEIDPATEARRSPEPPRAADPPAPRTIRRDVQLASAEPRSMFTSPRRMPPVPEIDLSTQTEDPTQVAKRDDVKAPAGHKAREEDSQARQARAREEDAPAAPAGPLLAVVQGGAAREADRSLDPPKIEEPPAANPEVKPQPQPKPESQPQPEPEAEPAPEPEAAPSPEGRSEGEPSQEADAPPPIETPAPAHAESRPPADPDAGNDPVLAGRPRMPSPNRDPHAPDLPPVTFPRTYYEAQGQVPPPRVAPQPRADRWTWQPKLFRRLRGETAPTATTAR